MRFIHSSSSTRGCPKLDSHRAPGSERHNRRALVLPMLILGLLTCLAWLTPNAPAFAAPTDFEPASAAPSPDSANALVLALPDTGVADLDWKSPRLAKFAQKAGFANLMLTSREESVTLTQTAKQLKMTPIGLSDFSCTGLQKAPQLVDLSRGVTADSPADRAAQVEERLAHALEASADCPARIIVASLSDAGPADLHALAVSDPESHQAGALYSDNTRRAGLLTVADLKYLINGGAVNTSRELGTNPGEITGNLVSAQVHAHAAKNTIAPWFLTWALLMAAGVIAAGSVGWLVRYRHKTVSVRTWRALTWWNTISFAWVPAALILNFVPWWAYSTHPSIPILLTALIAVVLTAVARQTAIPIGVLAATTLLLLVTDIVSATSYQLDGFLGPLTLIFRRFYGVSNREYVILVVTAFISLLPYVHAQLKAGKRYAAVGAVALMGVGVLCVDALPVWGADFGGVPGIVGGFLLACILLLGMRLRWWHALLWIGASALGWVLIAVVDAHAPQPTHVGRLWRALVSGEGWQVLARKWSDMTASVLNPITVAVVVVLAVVALGLVWAMRRGRFSAVGQWLGSVPGLPMPRERGSKALLVSMGFAILVAVLVNDSGLIIIADGLLIGLPPVTALITRQFQELAARG